MHKIYENLSDPSWWFTGVFFVVLALLLAWMVKKLPFIREKVSRRVKLKMLKRIRKERWSAELVNYQINKLQSRYIIFIITCLVYLFWFAYEPFKVIFEQSVWLGLFLSSPIFILEVSWLTHNSYVLSLIQYRRKLCSSKQSR